MNISHLVKMCAMYASSSELANSPLPCQSYGNRLPRRLDGKINGAKLKLILAITSLTLHVKYHCVNATDCFVIVKALLLGQFWFREWLCANEQ